MRRWGEVGVTFPEVLVAVLLIGIVLVPLLHLYPLTIDADQSSQVHTILSAVAVRKTEEIIRVIRAGTSSPVQYDNSVGAAADLVPSSSATLTIAASANYVLILVGIVNTTYTVSAVTIGGVAATRITQRNHLNGTLRGELWGLLNPPTGAQAVSVTLTGSMYHAWVAASFAGVNPDTPLDSTATGEGTSGTPARGVGTRTYNTLLVGGFAFRTATLTVTEGAGQTPILSEVTSGVATHMSRETSAGSAGGNLSWTVQFQSNDWVALVTELRGVGGAAGSTSGSAACTDLPTCRLVWSTTTEQSSATPGVGRLDQVNVVACQSPNATCDPGEPQVRYDTKVTTRP